jgi:hypothetical protein
MGRHVSKKGIGWRWHMVFGSWLLGLIYLIIGYSVPYSWYVQVDSVVAQDVCVGSSVINVVAERNPAWTMPGTTYAELVRYDGDTFYETIHRRGTRENPKDWTYEADTYRASYGTEWNQAITEPGEYSIRSWNTINPLPFIYREEYTDETQSNKFNVIVCDQ